MLCSSMSTLFQNGSCSEHASQESFFSWRETISSTSSRRVRFTFFLALSFWSSFKVLVLIFERISILAAAGSCCDFHDDCVYSNTDGDRFHSRKLLHQLSLFRHCRTSCWWTSRADYDCSTPFRVLQAKATLFLSSLGLCNPCNNLKSPSLFLWIPRLDLPHLLCHRIHSWSLTVRSFKTIPCLLLIQIRMLDKFNVNLK